jgi:hypothetical protein
VESELYVTVIFEDEMAHRARRALQQHSMEVIVRLRSPLSYQIDRFSFTRRKLNRGGGRQEYVLNTSAGQMGGERNRRTRPVESAPDCRTSYRCALQSLVAGSMSFLGVAGGRRTTARRGMPFHRHRLQAMQTSCVFNGRPTFQSQQHKREVCAGTGDGTTTRTRRNSHRRSSLIRRFPIGPGHSHWTLVGTSPNQSILLDLKRRLRSAPECQLVDRVLGAYEILAEFGFECLRPTNSIDIEML